LAGISVIDYSFEYIFRENKMEKVTGIGGFFFRAKQPSEVAKWYLDNLGIDLVPQDYETQPWTTEQGVTVFAPFQHDTDYFSRPEQQWMLNFRVNDLDAMVAQLRANGNEVEVEAEEYPNGRFAKVHDPEGNPLQLWEPK
jgi:predicted enzyme related to lactoylglutathione lyase